MVDSIRRPVVAALTILAALAVLAISGPLHAAEEITDFHVSVTVEAGGAIEVRERIEVIAEGSQIKRGIFRDLPQIRSFGFMSMRLPIEVVEVKRDGEPEPFHIASTGDGIRIYIGSSDRYVDHGGHTYELVYRSRGQLGAFDDRDELFWNVTGHQWKLPIARASVEVKLPPSTPTDAVKLRGFTGSAGSRDDDASGAVERSGVVHMATTAPLEPGQGLSIVVGWPKGHVARPGIGERFGWMLRGWVQVTLSTTFGKVLVAATGGLLALFLFSWLIWGRDPRRRRLQPQLVPPANLSAAEAYVLSRMGWSDKALSIALIELAVRRKLRIEETNPGSWSLLFAGPPVFELSREQRRAIFGDLSEAQRGLLDALFASGRRVSLGQQGHDKLLRAYAKLKSAVDKRSETLFSSPLSMLGGGADAFAVALIGGAGMFVFTSMIAAIGTGITALISWAVAAVLLVIAGLWWSRAIRRRTVEGRRLMDELEALRRGIESPGIAGFAPSEQLLPFAMALGVESRWADRIDREIRAAIGVQPGNPTPNYQPDWLHAGYLGTCIVASPLAICRTLHGALDHAVPTTSSSSSSSSGGGGGFDSGFSGSSGVGGGGGGGGGGGW